MPSKVLKQQKQSPGKGKGKEKAVEPVSTHQEPDSASTDSEGSEIGEEGLGKLMSALGEDGLDDVAQQMLTELYGGEEDEDEEDGDEREEDMDGRSKVQIRANADSDESQDESEEGDISGAEENFGASAEEGDEEEDEDAVELDEVSSVDDDAVPRQKITIDNKDALERIRDSIMLDASLPWTETLATTYPSTHNADVSDDLAREVSFYKQAMHSAEAARALAESHALPFTRPPDYFAEMVKSDAHMERIRQRLLDETAGIKKGEEKRREREGKKFGKQIQIEKVRERERGRKDLDEKIKGLKRKRKGGALDDTQGEDFEVALEDAITDRPTKRARMPRTSRDEKYGRGGRGSVGWRSKQNTRESTDQFESVGRGRGRGGGRGGRGGRGGDRGGRGGRGGGPSRGVSRGAKRLGKSRRQAGKGK